MSFADQRVSLLKFIHNINEEQKYFPLVVSASMEQNLNNIISNFLSTNIELG